MFPLSQFAERFTRAKGANGDTAYWGHGERAGSGWEVPPTDPALNLGAFGAVIRDSGGPGWTFDHAGFG